MREKIEQAAALFGADRPREALEILRQVIAADPGYARAHTISARCWLSLGHRDKAVEHLNYAARLSDTAPDPAQAKAALTSFFEVAGDHARALELIEQAAAMRPDNLDLKLRHAGLLCGADRWRDALEIFENAVKRLPDDARLLKSTGIAAQMCGQATRAVELYIRTLAAGGADREVYANLIGSLVQLGRIDEAHRHAADWLKARPGDIDAMAFVALLEVEVGNEQAAGQWFDFERFVRVAPVEPPASYGDLDAFNRELEAIVLADEQLGLPARAARDQSSLRVGYGVGANKAAAIGELEAIIRNAVDKYLADVTGDEQHPFLKQRPGDYTIDVWSHGIDVEGSDEQHINMSGYLSGCYFVTVPEELAASSAGSAGAVELGRPPAALPFKASFPVKTVRPDQGLLLLFPAFMYHGTAPFKAQGHHICISFDVSPVNRARAAA